MSWEYSSVKQVSKIEYLGPHRIQSTAGQSSNGSVRVVDFDMKKTDQTAARPEESTQKEFREKE